VIDEGVSNFLWSFYELLMFHEAGVRVHWHKYPIERFEFEFEFFLYT
jgi:hypothetical protein